MNAFHVLRCWSPGRQGKIKVLANDIYEMLVVRFPAALFAAKGRIVLDKMLTL
jgi:hypothetical protein